MSIDISGFFQKIGKIGGVLSAKDYYVNNLPTKFGDIDTLFTSDKDLLDTLYATLTSGQSLPVSTAQAMRDLAQRTLVRIANNDQPTVGMTGAQAMGILITQMKAGSQTVAANTVGLSVATGTNVGNGTLLSSIKRNDGLNSEYALAEAIALKVISDSYSGGVVVGNELVGVSGVPGVDVLDAGWPKGSGATATLTAVDPTQDAQGGYGQYLVNGDMESFTSNVPDSWTIAAGVAGTSILKQTSTTFDGAACLGYVGDASTQHSVTQAFGGPASALTPSTTYGVSLWIRVATVPAAGVLSVDLYNGASTVNDAQGTANSFTKTLSTLTANTWTNINGIFRTPASPTSGLSLRLRCSTAISSGTTLLIDRIAFTKLYPLYLGGPMFAVVSGATPFFFGDSWTATVTNNRAGATQTMFDRLFGMRAMGLQLPSSGSPSITDSYIPAP